MYTSFYSKSSKQGPNSIKKVKSRASASDIMSISGLEVNVRPVLEYNAKLMNGKLTVNHIFKTKGQENHE